jgi:hypothetical protein
VLQKICFRSSRDGRELHHHHDFNCATGAAGFFIRAGGPTVKRGIFVSVIDLQVAINRSLSNTTRPAEWIIQLSEGLARHETHSRRNLLGRRKTSPLRC